MSHEKLRQFPKSARSPIARKDLEHLLPDRSCRPRRGIGPTVLSKQVRRRLAKQVANLDRDGERGAMRWMEAVSEFDAR